ncbi:MAG TPA: sigma-70 family RNA polymerase sigma factor [Coleofasciculaceae cyanobacterium]|jgi:RNA polymerase sigma-70 factor (ECF subfamily)
MSSELPSYSCKADADLFLLLQNGQTDILAILYNRHAALVYGIALRLLKNTTEAEDLTQDIFLILTKKCSYDPKRGTLRTYLAILTRSRALDRLRSRSKNQKRLHNQSLNESAKALSESPMVEVSQVERSHEVQQALKQLSTQEQQVLRMAYYQDLSQSEIAKQLNIALGTVKSRSRRGLLKLRQALINLREHS